MASDQADSTWTHETSDAQGDDDKQADRNDTSFFLWGPKDSFNYLEPGGSDDNEGPLTTSSVVSGENLQSADFLSLVTTISQAYRQDRYLAMRPLDDIQWNRFDGGSIFEVSKSDLTFKVVSLIDPNKLESVSNKVVIKRIKGWSVSETQVRAFNRELRILDHFHDDSGIVSLRGIGWFYNADSVSISPEPVLMLEPAYSTMRYLMTPSGGLSLAAMWAIFYDIAKALSSLHRQGVVHGDIKLENVLLFPSQRFEEGIEIRTYNAKLSDFNMAMFDNGGLQRKLGTTLNYTAPESELFLTFPQLQKTDVYSFGVMAAMIMSKTDDLRRLNELQKSIDSLGDEPAFVAQILSQASNEAEGSTFSRTEYDLVISLFMNTLRVNPVDRCLPKLMRSFETYFDLPRYTTQASEILRDSEPSDLEVSYGKFMDLSGIIKDNITKSLTELTKRGDLDPRQPKAFFELGVIYLSKFGDPRASKSIGIQHVWDAAERGDLRARALYERLQTGFNCLVHPEYHNFRLQWLSSAAEAGYYTAWRDLMKEDQHIALLSLQKYGAACIQRAFSKQLSDGTGALALHEAAATGSHESLVTILRQEPELLNFQNDAGDTALLTACRFGQYKTASLLLKRSADASLSNKTGENGLHFLWRFGTRQASTLLGALLERGADPDQAAFFSQRSKPWDMVPVLCGTPIERLSSYNRLDLVKMMIERGLKITPRNGNQLRRMLLVAIRLQHVSIQKYLIRYASVRDEDFQADIRPLKDAGWEYKGKRRHFGNAAILGWARPTGSGIDVPLDFWQAAYHGKTWDVMMKATIDITMRLQDPLNFDEESLDITLQLAIQEKAYHAFEYLLNLKIQSTAGAHARMCDLEPLCWREGDFVMGRPIKHIEYVDQIFYSSESGTLTQNAIRSGDRMLFHLLTRIYGASVSLPFPSKVGNGQVNCYSEVGRSSHHDLWFVHEFYDLNISMLCPYEDAIQSSGAWRHPLADSLSSRYWSMSSYLIAHGARISDKMANGETVLDQVFAIRPLPSDVIKFLFPIDDPERSLTWWVHAELEKQGGYPVFCLVYKALDKHGSDTPDALQLCIIWSLLLEHYPQVENMPPNSKTSVVWMTTDLFRRIFHKTTDSLSFQIQIVPGVNTKLTLSKSKQKRWHCQLTIVLNNRPKFRFKPLQLLAETFYFGSPMDDVPPGQYFQAALWRSGYLPSYRHWELNRIYGIIFLSALGMFIFIGSIWLVLAGYLPRILWGAFGIFLFLLDIFLLFAALVGVFTVGALMYILFSELVIPNFGFVMQSFSVGTVRVARFMDPRNCWRSKSSWLVKYQSGTLQESMATENSVGEGEGSIEIG